MNTRQTSSELSSVKDFASQLIRTTSQFYPAEPRSQAPSTSESDLQPPQTSIKPQHPIEHSTQKSPTNNTPPPTVPTTPTTPPQLPPHPQNPPHLLTLPPEIRTHIYALALTYPQPLWWQDTSRPHPLPPPTTTALLSVSHLTHTEATPLFYASNTFHFPTLIPSLSPIIESQPNIALMQHIILHYAWVHLPSNSDTPESRLSFRMLSFLAKDVDAMIAEVDSVVAVCLWEIVEACPGLRSLRVYMPGVRELEGLGGVRGVVGVSA